MLRLIVTNIILALYMSFNSARKTVVVVNNCLSNIINDHL